ncbi:MAG: HAD family phosphatase [Erysipelotrichaceae bacterium]
MKKKAILFDMDGTLIDTTANLNAEKKQKKQSLSTRYFNYRMSKLKSYSYASIDKMVSKDILMKHKKESIMKKMDMIMQKRYMNSSLKNGAKEFLKLVKEQGFTLCLCTNNSYEMIEFILKEKELEGIFDHYVTSFDVTNGKPSPDIYNEAQSKTAYGKEDCIIFEDTLDGIIAARAANIDYIAVYDPTNSRSDITMKDGAILSISDYKDIELLKLFKERN